MHYNSIPEKNVQSLLFPEPLSDSISSRELAFLHSDTEDVSVGKITTRAKMVTVVCLDTRLAIIAIQLTWRYFSPGTVYLSLGT